MAATAFAANVSQSVVVTGTGTITLGTTPTNNTSQTFATAFPSGATITYAIKDSVAGAWEVGIGVFSGGTLTRTAKESSNGGALVPFAGNACTVSVVIASPVVQGGNATDSGLVPALNPSGILDATFSPPAVLQAVLSSSVPAMHNNPHTRGTVIGDVPTVSIASSLPARFTRTSVFGAAGAPFVSGGGTPTTVSGVTTFPCVTQSATSGLLGMHWRVETLVDGTEVCFALDGVAADGYRFIVDGRYVTMAGTATALGSPAYYTLTFNSRRLRRVVVEGHDLLSFRSASVADHDVLIAPALTYRPQIFMIGDSNLEGYGVALKGDSLAGALSNHLGVLDVRGSGVFGTGFLETNSPNNYYAYSQRRSDWVNANPDMLIYSLSINDANYSTSFTPTQVANAVLAEIAYVRSQKGASFPIIIYGVQTTNEYIIANDSALYTLLQNQETAVINAVAALNDPFVAVIPTMTTGNNGIFTGTSSTTGTGPYYANYSTGHATAQGLVMATYPMAMNIVSAIAAMAGKRVPAYWSEEKTADLQLTENFYETGLPATPLVWAYTGGVINNNGTPTVVPPGTLTLAASATTYVSVSPAGVVSQSTTGWTAGNFPMRLITTSATEITSSVDARGYIFSYVP